MKATFQPDCESLLESLPLDLCVSICFLIVLDSPAVHCGGAGHLFLLHLVHSGPLRLPYLPNSLQPHHERRRESFACIFYERIE